MSTERNSGILDSLKQWCFLTGSRSALAALVLLGVLCVTAVLVDTGVMYVGSGSALRGLLSSGMFSGLLTLLTVSLSINQLILSRIFGSPSGLTDRLEGNLDFRRNIEEIADVPTSPNDPASFLGMVAGELESRAAELERTVARSNPDLHGEFESSATDLVDYAEHLGAVKEGDDPFELLDLMLGSEYAEHIDTVRELRAKYGEQLSEEACDHLDAILELLKAVSVIRQFFKTLAIQQDLATLSRRLIYTGVVALFTAYVSTAVYTSSSTLPTTISAAHMPVVVTVVTPILFTPVVVLVVYLLRVATIALYTTSVGPFVPPVEQVKRA
ncbi:hypothetical protein SAMN04487950_2983 [Halogranum rubrum]|uniref:Uncharacterized protein n=1 Tax=Halogranum rubrum TaxID=553466 RepID=A0A1I4G3J8_9EURY|nr:hypothetical protein [Halogranum rubrum]SFL23827.1 hypothetical protein SAMN04487950_2983 [Halogranum rubrum]